MTTHSYLVRNRHGAFYFRATIPKHLRQHFPNHKREIKRSLKTDSRKLAIIRARAYRAEFDKMIEELDEAERKREFEKLRAVNPHAFSVRLEAVREVTMPDGTEHTITATSERDISQPAGDVANYPHTRQLPPEVVKQVSAENLPIKAHMLGQLREDELQLHKIAAIQPAAVTATPRQPNVRSALLSEVIAQFIEHKTHHDKKKWRDPTHQKGRLKTILEILGERPCHELTGMDAIKVEETIPKLPARLNQGQLAKLPDIQSKIDTDPAIYPRIDRNTQSKYWNVFCDFIKFAREMNYITENITRDRRGIAFSKEEKEDAEYDRFTDIELQRLFSEHVYRPEKLKGSAGHSYHFWLPLLAAYTGARQNELCQLRLSDIKQSDDGIWYIDITDEEEEGSRRKAKEKSLKSKAAKRLVPIHHQLIALDFLDFVKEERAGPYPHMLFSSGLSCSKTGKWNKNASKWFNGEAESDGKQVRGTKGYKQHCGFETCSGKVFHSFRKSFATKLFAKDKNIMEISRLIGHEKRLLGHTTTYIKESTEEKLAHLPTTKKYIDKLEYKIDLSHVSYSQFRQKYI